MSSPCTRCPPAIALEAYAEAQLAAPTSWTEDAEPWTVQVLPPVALVNSGAAVIIIAEDPVAETPRMREQRTRFYLARALEPRSGYGVVDAAAPGSDAAID